MILNLLVISNRNTCNVSTNCCNFTITSIQTEINRPTSVDKKPLPLLIPVTALATTATPVPDPVDAEEGC